MSALTAWIDRAGKYTVNKVPCHNLSEPAILTSARTGVLHTTEGAWAGAMTEFKVKYAPHFIIGLNEKKKPSISQLVPIGLMGAALKAHNNLALVQVEMVGFSQEKLWLPDDGTLDVLASLMIVCRDEWGIPLSHPWIDGDFGRASDNPHRHAGKYGIVPGWFGHGDMPLPDSHWDPGALAWSKVFAHAESLSAPIKAPVPVAAKPISHADR